MNIIYFKLFSKDFHLIFPKNILKNTNYRKISDKNYEKKYEVTY